MGTCIGLSTVIAELLGSAAIAVVVIVGVREGKVAYEHIYWDQAGLLVQLGLLDPSGLPIGLDTASRLLAVTGKG